jgi:hypothetical protein
MTRRPAWWSDAACRAAPVSITWFPERGQDGTRAVEVCRSCLVLEECRTWSLDQGPGLVGIFGGLTEKDRRKLRTEQKAA